MFLWTAMLSGAVAETFALMIEMIQSSILLSHLLTKRLYQAFQVSRKLATAKSELYRECLVHIFVQPQKNISG